MEGQAAREASPAGCRRTRDGAGKGMARGSASPGARRAGSQHSDIDGDLRYPLRALLLGPASWLKSATGWLASAMIGNSQIFEGQFGSAF